MTGPSAKRRGSDRSLADRCADDDETIVYTNGTTVGPTGAVQTHRSLGAFLTNGVDRAVARPVTPLTLPLFHLGGLRYVAAP
jgi:long-subunit acyl-CoA synthetase (AMP-forming)